MHTELSSAPGETARPLATDPTGTLHLEGLTVGGLNVEPWLGLPDEDGYVLASDTEGVRSWVPMRRWEVVVMDGEAVVMGGDWLYTGVD